MTKESRPFSDMERDKQELLYLPLMLLNMAVRGYSYAIAHDTQDQRKFSKNDIHQDIIRNNRAVALLHSVPLTAVEGLKKIFDKAGLPYTCDKHLDPHRKRALFCVDISRATTISVTLAADEMINIIQKETGKNFGAVMRKITPRGKGNMVVFNGEKQGAGLSDAARNFRLVPRGTMFTLVEADKNDQAVEVDNSPPANKFQMRLVPSPNSLEYEVGWKR